MKRACIAIVDAARARIFVYDHGALREICDLASAGRRMNPGDRLADPRPGSERGPSGQHTALDDHRANKLANQDMEHAKQAAGQILHVVGAHHVEHLIVVASPHMLGQLRRQGYPDGVEVDELARDLTHLTEAQLHDHLARAGLVDPRPRLRGVR